jgi:hypothetical protein
MHCISSGSVRPSPGRSWSSASRPGFGLKEKKAMLYTIAVILLVLWLLGIVSGYTVGAFIHVLLVIAIVLFLVGVLGGRRVV